MAIRNDKIYTMKSLVSDLIASTSCIDIDAVPAQRLFCSTLERVRSQES